MKNVKENVAIAFLITSLIVTAFRSVEIRLGLFTAIIMVITYQALVPALWEKHHSAWVQ